ncbi:MAG: cadherin domain-containing protein [Planctomycetales bacterium]|nr:cadherin domain-containing protein [Planctomycetales bacterium]
MKFLAHLKSPTCSMRAKQRRKQLVFEALEARRVLAAYINEIHFKPLFGSTSEDQYIELRGEPATQLSPGTYFVSIASADGVDELGDIKSIFDLGGLSFGDNGFLVLEQAGGGYQNSPDANIYKGTDGFQGLGGNRFLADGNSLSISSGSSTFLLIQTETPPTLTTDIDSNDDGLPDGAYLEWQILDSLAVLPWVESVFKQRTYAGITFSEDNVGGGMPGTTIVTSDQLAYAGRIGNSVGHNASDWMAGNTVEVADDTWEFQLQHGVFGTPRPYAYGGRVLNHVGAPNWYGSVSGTIFRDDNQDGIQQSAEPGVPEVPVTVIPSSTIAVGSVVEQTVDPDKFPVDSDLSNSSMFFTMVSAGADNVPQGFKIRNVQRFGSSPGDFIYSHEGVGFFNNNRRIRMDFYQPVSSVSINVIGDSNFTPTYGRLEIFDSNNNSLGFVYTSPLLDNQEQRLSFSRPQNDIAWAIAYPDDTHLNSSPFGQLEDITIAFVPDRFKANSALDGSYNIPWMPMDDYVVQVTPPMGYQQVFPSGSGQHTVTLSGWNENLGGLNFGLVGGIPPTIENQQLSVSEDAAPGNLAALQITLGYLSQTVAISILSGDPLGIFGVNTSTRQLQLLTKKLDFETQPEFDLVIQVSDASNSQLADTATIHINVTNANDAPIVNSKSTSIPENSATGTAVTVMQATDQDSGVDGEFDWSIVAGNTSGAFAIDNMGEVTVVDPLPLDFESTATWVLKIRATDHGSPPLSGEAQLTVTLTNVNEPPTIPAQTMQIGENQPAGSAVGNLIVQDQDVGQNWTYRILGGSGADIFDIDQLGAIKLSKAILNFEDTSTYDLVVDASDSGTPTLSGTGTVTIEVLDRNDAPNLVTSELSIEENSTGDIGTLIANDEDIQQVLHYSITGGPDSSLFEINSDTGKLSISPGAIIDFESSPELAIQITVSDSGVPTKSTSGLVNIHVSNVNEKPIIDSQQLVVTENAADGSVVAVVSAHDPDNGDSLSFRLVDQNPTWFEIVALTGELKVIPGADIDFETLAEGNIVVEVVDSLGLSNQANITINVTDANDPPLVNQAVGSINVNLNEPFTFSFPGNEFLDPDANDTLTFSLLTATGFALPRWLTFDKATLTLSGTPATENVGTLKLKMLAFDSHQSFVADEFDLIVNGNLKPWHNAVMPLDVSNDTAVTPIDALMIINYINSGRPSNVAPNAQPEFGFLDTNGDNIIAPIDALLVINRLNSESAGEGESAPGVENSTLPSDEALFQMFAYDWESRRLKSRR